MSHNGSPSPGEWAGIISAIAGAVFGFGKGIQWLFSWKARREDGRAAKLQAWHNELSAERDRLAIERAELHEAVVKRVDGLQAEVGVLRDENSALRIAFELVATPLRAIDPGNSALARAEQLLTSAFRRLDPTPTPDMAGPLGKLNEID